MTARWLRENSQNQSCEDKPFLRNSQSSPRIPAIKRLKLPDTPTATKAPVKSAAMSDPLQQLHDDIDTRTNLIRTHRADWPCGKGCDGCCRRLAEMPRLTSAEWALLKQGLAELPAERRLTLQKEVAALAEQSGPLVCPLLEPATGVCPVYAQRPVACRTYGFYVQRNLGLYCSDIEVRVATGSLADVVWGNHDAIDRRLSKLGEVRSLAEWFVSEGLVARD